MKIKSMRRLLAVFLAVSMLVLNGCSAEKEAAYTAENGQYVIPSFRSSGFNENKAVDHGVIEIDTSSVSEGYVALRAHCGGRMKFQTVRGENKYNYDITEGKIEIIPLNMGNGKYSFKLMEQISGSKYACVWSEECDVEMDDEFQPFLRASQIVAYEEGSRCTEKAREIASACDTDTEVAAAIYEYLVKNISYDKEKAENAQPGYLPNPDETLSTGKGMCFDYAALAAAMMRGIGIPCKLITGYVDDGMYHAWNSVYLKEQGWVTVQIKAPGNSWKRIDVTFAANGTPTDRLQNDELYTTRYVY